MLSLKEESPVGTRLTDLHVFSEAPQSAQATPESDCATRPRDPLTEFESKSIIVAPFAITATIASATILSDAIPTTPPYNDDANYILSSATTAVPADTPTATPPKDEYSEDADLNSESDCPALEDESPYDALYQDIDFANDAPIPAKPASKFGYPAEKRRVLRSMSPANAHIGLTVGCAETARDLDCRDLSNVSGAEHTDAVDAHDREKLKGSHSVPTATPPRPSIYLEAPVADQESAFYSTPSDDAIVPRRLPKSRRRAGKSTSSGATTPATSSPVIKVESTDVKLPERRTSKRLSLSASAAKASTVAKETPTSTAKQSANPSAKSRSRSTPAPSDISSPVPRRVTRLSGLACDLSIPKPSPKAAASSKRKRRGSEKDAEANLPRELRRLQDTKEFSHVDDEPIIYTVWSNGRYVPANAAGEPLVDKNAANKTRLAKAAEEAERLRLAKEEAARVKEAEEKAAAEAARSVQKRVKKWSSSGLYAGQETPTNLAAGLTLAERKSLSKLPELTKAYPPNKTLSMPIYNGLRMLIHGRDFKLPFDVFNPLPPGQPKPVKYGRFSKNRFVGDAHSIWKKNPNYDDFQSKCVCKPETGCDEDCQNRIMLYECNDEICNVGSERCSNREFQRLAERTASKNSFHIGVEVFKTPDRGHGIRASRAFRPGQIIMEYIGEIITEEESDRRMNELYKDNECYYLMSFDQSLIIDGTSGSIARFVNHSCSPNCRMIKWIVSGQPRIALFAGDRPIMTGEELTYDYNFDPYSAKNVQGCLCGAENCRGVLGPRKSERVTKGSAEKTTAERPAAGKANGKAKGTTSSAKRKHDSYGLDDDDEPNVPVNKKMRMSDSHTAQARPSKSTRTTSPQKAVMTTKAALEALAANDARIARLTKASHASRVARQAKAVEKAKELQSTQSKRARVTTTKAATVAPATMASKARTSKTSSAARQTTRAATAAKSAVAVKTAYSTRRIGKATESTASSQRATTPAATKSRAYSSPSMSPQASPMAQAVAKAAKKTQIQAKSSVMKAGVTKKLTKGKATKTTTFKSDSTPIARGKGRSKLAARDASRMSAPSIVVYTNERADEEEELAAQLASEAAATSTSLAEPMDIDRSEDESTAQPMRMRKKSKSEKLRAKRQHVAALRSAERENGIYVPKRGPGRPRKQRTTTTEPDLDDTATSSDTQVAAGRPVSAALMHTWPAVNPATLAPTARLVKVKVRYGAARRGDVEKFKAARARARARMEQRRLLGGDAEGTSTSSEDSDSSDSSPERELVTKDVIHVATGPYLQV
ncbi:hypothetical protein SEPCBS57363_000696 [Sporothrix epigloea]|uniref:Histone-lysine N-methyltransferase ASH1L n=1 Tax=Sporothrix epigloea TaxID=1892477 RepID=A0ABP0D9U8_9PEZI